MISCPVWEAVDHHTASMNDQKAYTGLKEAFGPCVAEGATQTIVHVHFEPDAETAAALNAPITSFTHMPSYTSKGANGALFAELKKRYKSIAQSSGCHGGAYGRLVERDEYAVLYGWERIEVGYAGVVRTKILTFCNRTISKL